MSKNAINQEEEPKSSSEKLFVYSLIALVPILGIGAEVWLVHSHHDDTLHILEFVIPVLLFAISFMAVLLYRAYRNANVRSERLTEERDHSNELASRLAIQKSGVDAHAIVSITDPRGRILYVNDKFCAATQYDREDLIGQNHRILNSGTHEKGFFGEMYAAIKRGDSWSGEICNRAKDGSLTWLSSTIVPIHDENGVLQEILAIRTDITKLKETQDQLKHNNAILHGTFDNFPGAISAYDKDLILQIANPAFYELLGLPKEQFPIGSHFSDIIRFNAESGQYGEGDIDAMVEERVELARAFEPHQFIRRTSHGRVLDVCGWPLPDGGFISSHMDITEHENLVESLRTKNEEAQRSAETLLNAQNEQVKTHRHLLDSINSMRNGFAIWDADGKLVLANDSYCEFHGTLAGRILPGADYVNLLRDCCKYGHWSSSAHEGHNGYGLITELLDRHSQGTEFECEVRLSDGRRVVIDEQPQQSGEFITTLIDVTAHREREAELQRTKDALEHIAYYDALTTLPNRANCQHRLEELLNGPREENRFAIIQIDLDHFKRVNDTMGHAAGDHLLRELGARLSYFANQVPVFQPYRWGGDEFIAIVKDDGSALYDLESICQELNDLIAIPLHYEDTPLRPTVSLGVARYPKDATDLESLMIFADLALYKTKQMGRDGYQFFSAEMKEKVDIDCKIESGIREALEKDQFELYFQPQINTIDESVTGVEALLRWNHPEQGLLPPGLFMDVVENHGLASVMSNMVIDKAMRAARGWLDEGFEFGRLAINLSPGHLQKQTLVEDFFATLDRHHMPPEHVAVELLESFLLDDPDTDIPDMLAKFAERGVHVELDDFGTGYASLSHLSNLPIDGIKIDRSFIENIEVDERQQAIVEVVMSMSRLMQLRVVCEGIETHEQLKTVSRISNCSIQGYLVSRPLSAKDIGRWFRHHRNKGLLTPPEPRNGGSQSLTDEEMAMILPARSDKLEQTG